MKVTLVDYTQDAAPKLIFTKATRLNMSAALYDEIFKKCYKPTPLGQFMDEDEPELTEWAEQELAYMAKTIPSSWEMVDFTFMIEGVSRAFTHQFVRTRHGSYAQQTMRMVNMDQFTYVTGPTILANEKAKMVYDIAMGQISQAYADLIELGIPPEDARGVLPTNICTNIVAKFNLRTLAEMCKSRTGGRTQDEYRQVLNAMADQALGVYPWLDLFLFPRGRQAFDNLEKLAAEVKKTNPALAIDALKDIDALRKGEM